LNLPCFVARDCPPPSCRSVCDQKLELNLRKVARWESRAAAAEALPSSPLMKLCVRFPSMILKPGDRYIVHLIVC
jgi:hypothetical protein